MSSSVMEFTAARENHGGRGEAAEKERLDLRVQGDPTALNELTLPTETFLIAALSLKDQVVDATWRGLVGGGLGLDPGLDPTVYSGLLGTAFTLLRSYEVTGNQTDLVLSGEMIDTCAAVARATTRHVTFLCGRGGIYALGAVVASYTGDHHKRHLYLSNFLHLAQEKALPVGPDEGGFGMSYDLLYGRAGFLWAALFLNNRLGRGSIPDDLLVPIVDAVLAGGRVGAAGHESCPLMFRFHGTRYWGAANGLAGILHVLLHFSLSEEDGEDVKGTLRYMMSKRFPHSGNYPSSEANSRDNLVQWSHGATSMAITLSMASQVFPNERDFRDAAIEAGEVVWKNGLVKKIGLAEGVAGNAYAFLSLYRLTGESIYRERAVAFSSFLYQNAKRIVNVGCGEPILHDHAYSLFHGLAGVSCLWFDLGSPENSRFPGYEV